MRRRDLADGVDRGPGDVDGALEVAAEVVAAFRRSFGATAESHLSPGDGGTRLDLWSANAQLLREEGVEHIEISHLCTACDTADWFSHRAEGGRTGRFGALVALAR